MQVNRWSKGYWYIGGVLLILLIAGLSTLFPLQGYGQGGLPGITGTPYYLPYVVKPHPTRAPTSTPIPTPTPTGVFIRNNYLLHNGHFIQEADPARNKHLLGEVFNNSPRTVNILSIQAIFEDSYGNMLWGLSTYTRRYVTFLPLRPGERMCFEMEPAYGIVYQEWDNVRFMFSTDGDNIPHPELAHRIVSISGNYPDSPVTVEYEFTNAYNLEIPKNYYPAQVIHYDPATGQLEWCRRISSSPSWPFNQSRTHTFTFLPNTNPYNPDHVYIQKPGYIEVFPRFEYPDYP